MKHMLIKIYSEIHLCISLFCILEVITLIKVTIENFQFMIVFHLGYDIYT